MVLPFVNESIAVTKKLCDGNWKSLFKKTVTFKRHLAKKGKWLSTKNNRSPKSSYPYNSQRYGFIAISIAKVCNESHTLP